MPKPKDPQSYEVAGTSYRQYEHPSSLLKQAFADYRTPDPSRNFTHRMNGNTVTIYCHCHERGLGEETRLHMQIDAMSKLTDDFVKNLKKKYKEMGGGTLSMKEKKEARGYDRQKVSLSDRWDIVYRRTYEVEDLIENPED